MRSLLALLLISAALVPVRADAQLASTSWPMFHAGLEHRGASAAPSLASGALRWTFAAADTIWGSAPALTPTGQIVVGAMDSCLYAVTAAGTLAWKFKAGGPLQYSSPAVAANGTVYVGGMDSTFYAVNPNGTLLWKYRAGSTVRSSPAIAPDGTIYVGSGDNNLYAFHPDGSVKWVHPAGGNVRSSPAVGPDGTVYVGSDDGFLYALDPTTGAENWRFSLGSGTDLASPMVGPDTTIYVGTTGWLFYAIHPNGTFKWVYSTGHAMDSAPALLPGGDLAITIGSDVRVLHAVDGTLAWRFVAAGLIRTSAAVAADGTIYAGSDDDTLYALNPNGTVKWAWGATHPIRSSPAIGADGTVYFGGFDGTLRALGTPLSAVDPAAPRGGAWLSAPWPNPARGAVGVTARAPAATPAALLVLGADGRRIRELWRGTLTPAPLALRWDGRDDAGRPAAPGVYWLSLRGGTIRDARAVVLER